MKTIKQSSRKIRAFVQSAAASCLIASFACHAAPPSEWVQVAVNNDGSGVWSAQQGSFKMHEENGGASYASVVMRIFIPATRRIFFLTNTISVTACNNKMGVMKSYNLDGSPLAYPEFVIGGGDSASQIAQVMCDAVQQEQDEINVGLARAAIKMSKQKN